MPYQNMKVVKWIDEDEFIGTIDYIARAGEDVFTQACYGWSKGEGKSFMVYLVDQGHIQKLATVKRDKVYQAKTVDSGIEQSIAELKDYGPEGCL